MENDVKIAYGKAKNEISNLIGFLQNELQSEPDDLNWGHVGTLNAIKENLLEILVAKTGFSKEEIENSLQELIS